MNDRREHLPCLDYFRGAAILLVISKHILWSLVITTYYTCQGDTIAQVALWGLAEILDMGSLGVAIFFVISGFCIHLSYRQSQQARFAPFYLRRVFRIYPAYLFSLLLFVFIWPSTRWPGNWYTDGFSWLSLISHLFLAHNVIPQAFVSIEVVYWSLAIEFQLYLLFPLLLFVAAKFGWRQALIVTAVVELVSRIGLIFTVPIMGRDYTGTNWAWQDISPFSFWFCWSLGALLAESYVENKPLPLRDGPLPLWMWPLLVYVIHRVPGLSYFQFPFAALASARFLAYFLNKRKSEFKGGYLTRIGLKILAFYGLISYSLYLLHFPMFGFFNEFIPRAHGGITMRFWHIGDVILALGIITAASYLLFLLVETTGVVLGKKVIRKLRPLVNPT